MQREGQCNEKDGVQLTATAHRTVQWLEKHQVALYLAAMGAGVLLGLTLPAAAPLMEAAINPAIAIMLWSTFLAIPLTHLARGFRDVRFLGILLALNFVAVPLVVWVLTRPLADQPALLVGVLLVLLVPCIDWVIVFTGLAGGDGARMTAASPVLMVAQMVLLAPLLLLIGGPGLVVDVDHGPFVEALFLLLLLPLAAAAAVQTGASRSRAAARVQAAGQGLMVPALMLVLVVVTASQVHAVGSRAGELIRAVPVFVAFVVVMTAIAAVTVRATRLPTATGRAVVFSAVARNSLVVLPFALALPERYDLAPLVVLTQTLVELVAMLILLRVVPLAIPTR